jgi:hypothetical protein
MLTSTRALFPRILFFAGLLVVTPAAGFAASPASQPAAATDPRMAQRAESYGQLPLSFEANSGPGAAFMARGAGYGIYLDGAGVQLALDKGGCASGAACAHHADLVRMRLAGSAAATPAGEQMLPGTVNYFIGSDPAQWRANVPTYARVRYPAVYPGIDLVYYGNQRQLEYDFVVAAGADPKPIRLQLSGVKQLRLGDDGALLITARGGSLAFHKPLVYQLVNGRRVPVAGRFTLLARSTVGFRLGAYDHARPLIIDPVLSYSTYLGGSGYSGGYGDEIMGIAVDAAGEVYVAGTAISTDFPVTKGSYQKTNHGNNDGYYNVFVTKMNSAGTELVYSTYLGGSGTYYGGDYCDALVVDGSGSAYVAGQTFSLDFPVTPGVIQAKNHATANNGSNAFVTKLNAAGTKLIYSTYLGGSGPGGWGDWVRGLAVDGSGNAYVAGISFSDDFPVTKLAYQTTNKGAASDNMQSNGFVSKLNATGTELIYSTFLGGSVSHAVNGGGDKVRALAIDDSGYAYVAGKAISTDFPVTKGAYQTKNKGAANNQINAFVTKLNTTGTELVYSTYLGGSGWSKGSGDWASALAVDGAGNAYITGQANSADFPVTTGAYQTVNNSANYKGINAFVTKLNATGSKLLYSTYLGGSAPCKGSGDSTTDTASSLAVDGFGHVYVTGAASSMDFPVTKGAYQPGNYAKACGASNAFVTELVPTSGALLVYSTYLGGSGVDANGVKGGDQANALALDGAGDVYIAGYAFSTDLPVTASAYQAKNKAADNTGFNGFITRLQFGDTTPAMTVTTLTASASTMAVGLPVTFTAQVTEPLGSEAPDGNVIFSVDGKAADTEALNDGQATYTTSSLAMGKHTVAVSYAGSIAYGASSASVAVTITGQAAAPTFSPAAGTYTAAQSVTLSSTTKGAAIYYTTNKTAPTTGSTKYTAAIKVSQTTTIEAIAVATGYINSIVATGTYTITPPAPTPTFLPVAGTYTSAQTVKITDKATTGLKIYYTTNGSAPTIKSTLYTSAGIKVSATETIKAVAVATGYSASAVASATYTITPPAPTPTFLPVAGTYTSAQTVKITDKATTGLKIYYTTNGSAPTIKSTLYTSAGIKVSATETIKAVAVATGYSASAVASATYTITPPAPTPTFLPVAGTYTSAQTVKITDKATTGLKIYYTTNGSAPTTKSTLYTSAGIKVSATETIKAVAVATGYSASAVASAKYTIN